MKLSRPLNRNIAHILMALALFVQWVVPASAYTASAQVAAPAQPGMACHHGDADRSICLTHCSQSDQASHDHAQLPALHAPAPVLHVALPPVQGLTCAVSPRTEDQLASASPPLSILYCSLLN